MIYRGEILFVEENEPEKPETPNYSLILHHVRATDRVFFGPFKNMTEVDNFFKSNPEAKKVSKSIEVLISPTCPPEHWWNNQIADIEGKIYKEFEALMD